MVLTDCLSQILEAAAWSKGAVSREVHVKYKKEDLITIVIEDMGMDGEGIGKIDGFPFLSKMQ